MLFFTFFIIIYLGCHLDLLFFNNLKLGGNIYPYFEVKFNNFFFTLSKVDSLRGLELNCTKINSPYLLNNSFSNNGFNLFGVISLDSYNVYNFITYVYINRTLVIYYYYYYLLILYLLYFLIALKLFFSYKNVFLFDSIP
jgi:hypothetical protein